MKLLDGAVVAVGVWFTATAAVIVVLAVTTALLRREPDTPNQRILGAERAPDSPERVPVIATTL